MKNGFMVFLDAKNGHTISISIIFIFNSYKIDKIFISSIQPNKSSETSSNHSWQALQVEQILTFTMAFMNCFEILSVLQFVKTLF